ncbi:MAG: dTDP-glucose 4,6-dehydratase [Rhodospirillaceae bacterium]|nr:dTDP-glucose 4,6-dehydratase [Rhodospirillaceae bacterium]
MKILVTGGAGFIGTELCRLLLSQPDVHILNVDCLSYAANLDGIRDLSVNDRYTFETGDVRDASKITALIEMFLPTAIIHLAAESHVDRSIDDSSDFISTNILGTQILLDSVLGYWKKLDFEEQKVFRFLHVSTDEVFGSLGEEGKFREDSPYRPNSPYAASKAASNHLARAWHQTYGLPVLITNCSNNFGPYQFPEKLIPLMIGNALEGRPLPVYGSGQNIRDWLYVEDHARALLMVTQKGRVGETYNIGGGSERKNLDLVKELCNILDRLCPSSSIRSYSKLISFVEDRPGHDLRYSVDDSKIRKELQWKPKWNFEMGLEKTVLWYLNNRGWMEKVKVNSYSHARRGLVSR